MKHHPPLGPVGLGSAESVPDFLVLENSLSTVDSFVARATDCPERDGRQCLNRLPNLSSG